MAHLQLTPEGLPEREIFNGAIVWDDTHYCSVTALTPEEIEYFRVVPLLETQPPSHNKTTHSCTREGVEFVDSQWQYKWVINPLPEETILENLNRSKVIKNAQINMWRAQANQTTFTHLGKQIACDQLSRSDIDAVAGSVSLTGTFPQGFPNAWKAVDNTYIMIPDIAAFKAMYASMTLQGTINFGRSQTLKATLNAATTIEEVEAIVW